MFSCSNKRISSFFVAGVKNRTDDPDIFIFETYIQSYGVSSCSDWEKNSLEYLDMSAQYNFKYHPAHVSSKHSKTYDKIRTDRSKPLEYSAAPTVAGASLPSSTGSQVKNEWNDIRTASPLLSTAASSFGATDFSQTSFSSSSPSKLVPPPPAEENEWVPSLGPSNVKLAPPPPPPHEDSPWA